MSHGGERPILVPVIEGRDPVRGVVLLDSASAAFGVSQSVEIGGQVEAGTAHDTVDMVGKTSVMRDGISATDHNRPFTRETKEGGCLAEERKEGHEGNRELWSHGEDD